MKTSTDRNARPFPPKRLAGCAMVALLLVAGCGGPSPNDSTSADEATASSSMADPEIERVLARLPEEDREAARQQAICPVSGEPLGSMGVPLKVTVGERDVFVCCAGCDEAVLDDPDEYLSRLDESAGRSSER